VGAFIGADQHVRLAKAAQGLVVTGGQGLFDKLHAGLGAYRKTIVQLGRLPSFVGVDDEPGLWRCSPDGAQALVVAIAAKLDLQQRAGG
jgi:hypothetical protein